MILNSPYISGSLTVTGNITSQGGITISGSITSASYATTSSFATTASYANTSTSASYALTASFATNATNFTASNILASNTITAQTLVVQTVTSSIVYSSGSNKFGNQLTDVQQMTGSLRVTGSITQTGTNTTASFAGLVGIGTSSPADNLHIAASEVGNVGISVQNTNASYSSQLRFLNSAGTEKAAVTYVQSTTSLNLNVNQIDALTISSTGQVNISSAIASNPVVNITNTTAGGGGIVIQAGNSYANYAMKVLNAAGDEKLRLDGNGNLLVGYTTDQGYKFGVNGTSIFAGAALFSSSVTANSLTSNNAITSNGAISSGGGTISSYSGTPANVSNGGNTTFVYQQAGGEFAAGFMYSIIGLYAPSGTNILGVGQGYAYFFADGSTNGTSATAQIASGWSVAASATNAGAFTITFTNNSGATMTSVNYRIIKVNRIGAG